MPEEERGKTAFHWALAAVVMPFVALVISLVAGIRAAVDPTSGKGPWGTRLLLLALVDLHVIAGFLYVGFNADRFTPPDPHPPRFGVLLDGVRLREVVDGMPAAEAGLKAGDVLVEVEGTPVASPDEALRALHAAVKTPDARIQVRRGDEILDVRATARAFPPSQADPYQVHPGGDGLGVDARTLAGFGVVPAVAFGAWLGARRRPGPRVWRGVLLALGLFLAASAGMALLFKALHGGLSVVTSLLAMLVGHGALALGGLLASWALRRDRPSTPPPPRGAGRTLLLGVFYMLTVYPRAIILLAAFDLLFAGGQGPQGGVVHAMADALHGAWPVLLFVLAVAVVGPVAEELVFRGFLLPRLAARVGAPAALLVSSTVFGAMHAPYGVYAVITGVLGWILGWTRLSSGGLAVPIALHVAYNGFIVAVVLLRRSAG